ncbi:MAG TPA: type III pantothenate kinase [Nitrospiria bacterium]|jgi:type III pantothenate kinase
MILVVDVGNTNVVLGVYDGKNLLGHWRLGTHPHRTVDEHGILTLELLHSQSIDPKKIRGVILSCVVTPLLPVFEEVSSLYFKQKAMVVSSEMKMPIRNGYKAPEEVGADRLVNAVAAFEEFGGPVIIVDFGTAITICAVSEHGEYLGGIIAPGIQVSSDALFQRASKLPKVELLKPPQVIGKNTVSSIQSGLIYGFAGLVDELVKRMINELGGTPKVIATGGLVSLISKESLMIQEIRPFLTLEGLRKLYEFNL